MRACSFLPAATQIISRLGLEDRLVGVTFECALDRPRVVRSVLEGEQLSSAEIDRRVRNAQKSGESLYYLDQRLLEDLSPDIIFTQEVCSVCQIDTASTRSICSKLPKPPQIVSLDPMTLGDVLGNIRLLAETLGHPKRGEQLIESLEGRIAQVQDVLRRRNAPVRQVVFLEWVEPLYNAGHWIPEQINLAGAEDALSESGGYSGTLQWDDIRAADPEVIVVSPCGFDAARAREESKILKSYSGWKDLRAVKYSRMYAVDSHLFTEPGPALIDGIELLAALVNPELFELSAELKYRFSPILPGPPYSS